MGVFANRFNSCSASCDKRSSICFSSTSALWKIAAWASMPNALVNAGVIILLHEGTYGHHNQADYEDWRWLVDLAS